MNLHQSIPNLDIPMSSYLTHTLEEGLLAESTIDDSESTTIHSTTFHGYIVSSIIESICTNITRLYPIQEYLPMKELELILQEITSIGSDSGFNGTTVGTEAISHQMLNRHFDRLNVVSKKVINYIGNNNNAKVVNISLRDVTLNKNLNDVPYTTVRGVEVYKASAFIGQVTPFLTLLKKHVVDMKLVDTSLVSLEATISRFIMDPEDLTKVFTGLKPVKLKSGSKVVEDIGDYFIGREGIDTTQLGKVYGNMKHLHTAGTLSIALSEEFNGDDVQTLADRGDTLYKTLEYVEEALADKQLKMTDDWRHAIGEQLFIVTEWLAIYSLYLAKLVAVTHAHCDTVTKLNNM